MGWKREDLEERLGHPAQNWVDRLLFTVLEEPVFYGGVVCALFILLGLVALWATRLLLQEIEREQEQQKLTHDQGKLKKSQ